MGNTFFFKKVKEDVNKITWKDIFSESFKTHSKEERDHALAAGTALNRATEADMLSKWNKPFLWFPALKIGLAIVAVIYILYFGLLLATGSAGSNGTIMMLVCIPPIIIPLVVLVFLWELNIPKNISLLECIVWWVVGGILSLTINLALQYILANFFNFTISHENAYFAPIVEEPAKLIAAVVIIALAKRNRKIYGITGLVIGACVGAGFGAFESIGYAFKMVNEYRNIALVFQTEFVRGWTAFGGHTLYCAIYSAAMAYNMKNSKFSVYAFANIEFIATFLFSYLMHAIHNGLLEASSVNAVNKTINTIKGIMSEEAFKNTIYIIVIILLWIVLLWMLKKCLTQVVSIGRYSHDEYVNHHNAVRGNTYDRENHIVAGAVTLVCVSGAFKGSAWKTNGSSPVSIGRDPSNKIRLPEGTPGVSRRHCEIAYIGGAWQVKDMNSSHGTYVNNNKVAPGGSCRLKPNDVIRLADGRNSFVIKMN